ncbi:sigma-54-dependent transcriptional regulator [Roseimaritima ulvae]|uniref:Transcriptional regulatory protein ZraR n=1 Tax=Roseimaritima ulvae TaxID=980254 RepID=A0A5B9QY64_9BACT|nr:sigma-54 dependent transcriptional regulator [Roseimaritima ulvae]QEG42780.1 Transcriptional regulatory protein ZraR [Roseimaritima ulvae]
MRDSLSILLVDDDRYLAESMALWLAEQGYQVDTAGSLAAARAALDEHPYDLLITDLRLDDGDGFDLIQFTKRKLPGCEVLVVTGYATPETAIEAVRAGAFDLLTKPLIDEELTLAIDRAQSQRKIQAENERLKQQLDRRFGMDNILSQDYRMLKLFDVVDSVADARASVLVTGENGTGKSMIARAIHRRSNRNAGPFIEVACGALPDNLLESELFGHVAGAFTGASSDKVGKFKLADGGTLFLDEIGTATPAMQVKLLRVLQELQFEPLGSTKTESVDVRVILATNEDLTARVEQGSFRQDLYYRINVINIELPALRQRPGDIPLLVQHFIKRATESMDRQVEGFDTAALQVLQDYAWPGNVRELENVVERAILLSRGSTLGVEDLPADLIRGGRSSSVANSDGWTPAFSAGLSSGASDGQVTSLREALEEPERQIILEALRMFQWNRAATADALEINRTTLYKKMKRLGLDDPRLQYSS